MKQNANGTIAFDSSVFERPSIRRILDDGIVTEQEMREQTELTSDLYNKLAAELNQEQKQVLGELIDEVGVLFTISIYHNLKRL